MKTEFKHSNKDNIANAAILAASLLVVLSGAFSNNAAIASPATDVALQKMHTIVVTAPRVAPVMLETIVVTASRNSRAA